MSKESRALQKYPCRGLRPEVISLIDEELPHHPWIFQDPAMSLGISHAEAEFCSRERHQHLNLECAATQCCTNRKNQHDQGHCCLEHRGCGESSRRSLCLCLLPWVRKRARMSKVLGKRGKQKVGPGTRQVIYVCDSTSLPESGNLVWEDGQSGKIERLRH